VPSEWNPTWTATIATPSAENSSSTAVKQERDAQHRHGSHAQRLRRIEDPSGRGVHRAERMHGGQATQSVKQECVYLPISASCALLAARARQRRAP